MNILVDYHHTALLTSLYKLFVERLGWTMYIPMGMEWYEKEYWTIEFGGKSDFHYELAKQYLVSPTIPNFTVKTPETPHINYAYLFDIEAGLKFDVVLSSAPCRYPTFEKMNKDFGMKAKLIFQAGNNFAHDTPFLRDAKNLMSSATGPYQLMTHISNRVFYRQEFDLGLFRPDDKEVKINTVTNFQHNMCKSALFHAVEWSMPDWRFRSFGAGNRESALHLVSHVAAWMRKAGFIWHVKTLDEGYGHTIHNAFACGKPLITDTSYMTVYQQGKIPNTCMSLYTPDTIIDIKGMTQEEIRAEIVRRADNYGYYSDKVYSKFKEVVDFDREFVEVKAFLERLI